jgi:hypothetical protein
MVTKNLLKTLIFIMLSIVCSSLVLALGVSPATTNINFEPHKTKTVTLDIINSEGKSFTAKVYPAGELAEYITLEQDEIVFNGEGSKKITFTITLPEYFVSPGLHAGELKIQEIQTQDAKGNLNIKPSLGLVHQIYMHVPYPDKYAEARLMTTNVKKGDDIRFFIKVMNIGIENITKAYADIDIYDADGKHYRNIKTDTKQIATKKVGELIISLNSIGFISGDYSVNATVYYDDKPIYLSSRFSVDEFMIDLISITVDDYKLGQIAKFTILAQNIGNRLVKDFFSRIELKNPNNEIIVSLNSFNIDLSATETKETIAYWDTRDITVGEYTGTISLQYEEEVMEKKIKTFVREDEMEVEIIGITAMAINEEPGKLHSEKGLTTNSNINFQLSLIIILLTVIAGALIFRSVRSKKDTDSERNNDVPKKKKKP